MCVVLVVLLGLEGGGSVCLMVRSPACLPVAEGPAPPTGAAHVLLREASVRASELCLSSEGLSRRAARAHRVRRGAVRGVSASPGMPAEACQRAAAPRGLWEAANSPCSPWRRSSLCCQPVVSVCMRGLCGERPRGAWHTSTAGPQPPPSLYRPSANGSGAKCRLHPQALSLGVLRAGACPRLLGWVSYSCRRREGGGRLWVWRVWASVS